MFLRTITHSFLFLLASTGFSGVALAANELLLPPGYITSSTIGGNLTETTDSSNTGVVVINVASGEQNTQANNGSFALNLEGGPAASDVIVQQTVNSDLFISPEIAEAQIIGTSFNNTVGWIAINQASGQANAQINAFNFSEGSQATVQTALTQTITGNLRPQASRESAFGNPADYFGNPDDYFGNPDDYFDPPNGSDIIDTELGIDGELLANKALQATLSGEQSPLGDGSTRVQHALSVEDTAFKGARGLVQLNQAAGSGNSSVNNFALRVTVDAKL